MTPPTEPPSRTAQSSPIKGGAADARRPLSSGGSERSEPTKKKGMGVKEMEATVSTLHKQNFDLKLELYHHRERQTAMEERLEVLEAGKAQLEDVNDKLLEELEKRDRAVQEAVQMILILEAQVEKLVKEREMVRQVEAAGFSRLADLTAALNAPVAPEPRVINRMPSFLSERSESTANLRRVYLGTQGSLLNLPKVAETSPIADHVRSTSMALRSPSLSDLSESSFASVYGEKPGMDETLGDEQVEEMTIPDSITLRSKQRAGSNASDAGMTPKTRPSARGTRSSSINRPAFQSLNNVVDQGSPLQRLERSFSSNSESPGAERPSRPPPTQHPKRTREDKRDSLRRVTTDGPRNYDHAMPPTPDTISTTTLRRFKNSNETLTHQRNVQDRSYLALTEDTASTSTSTPDDRADGGAELNGGAPIAASTQPTPGTRVFSGGSYFDNRIPVAQRPRSADETTVSHRKGNAWDSEDEDDRASVQSLESSLDIWLQQGKEPKRRTGRESPDLFGFPSTANRWDGGAAFGKGAPLAAEGAPLHWPDPLNDLVPIQQELFGGGSGPAPPPPNRRSSLHARTGSTPPVTVRHHEPGNSKLRRAFSRAARRNSDTDRGAQQSQQQQQPEHPEGKQYPPLSRPQTVTPRNHRKINNLWRRSIGGSVPPANEYVQPPPSGPAPIDTAAANGGTASRRDSTVGTPSWVQRSSHVGEDEARATPPPIHRQPRRGSMVEGDGAGASVYADYPQTPGTPGEAAQGGASLGAPGSARRKWLTGFGRTSSIRSRGG
ncbi:hypothetical protein F5X68DRAFT_212523 [Plectosphaerella plurivora]|uniref:Centrosomin N-terminal motif 1 domain-containing protein n=1 Tax=Plectosphaerella plurivora TaxID=936078 RepID=A0A9P9A7W7_9PEZI|nr:hypothetical protein F5X68DRAFT_212523 [Plectosphaerella plurivora]